ncbi:hypothetical protein HW532_15885 [Kaustia mangrovi]|uniref:Uncharacterized protein n=1 Tax=Kaustia mangrovi TaxID=2593653 RepID=A0A7S8C616_9HYPH|nr:hypothetical protein [Kaustia mangrovi]QPC44042.1 hypothetical protein HW532_15885 [Kaustia mangrovi]
MPVIHDEIDARRLGRERRERQRRAVIRVLSLLAVVIVGFVIAALMAPPDEPVTAAEKRSKLFYDRIEPEDQ